MMYGNYAPGPQRAAARAHFHGLTVGAPVRAVVMTKTRPGPQRPPSPLERIDRMARYLLQRDVTTHVRHGSGWQPTPRQRRRLDHKARHAAAPFGRDYIAESYALAKLDTRGPAASAVIVDEPPQEFTPSDVWAKPTWVEPPPTVSIKPERERSAINPNGFRVVDRRGEHR